MQASIRFDQAACGERVQQGASESSTVQVGALVCKKTRPQSKFVVPPLAPFFFVRNRQPGESASAPWPPVKPIRQTFYASRHRRAGGFGRRRGKNRSPNSLPVSVVVGYFPTPKARDRASVAPSLLASLTAVIDKLGDFCARNSSSITNCSYLDNVKFGQ